MNIDHICIAVRSVDSASKRLCDLFGYRVKTGKVTNTRQKVNVLFLTKQDSLEIKLIEPSGIDSPLVEFIKKGGGLHHVCFKTNDVSTACNQLEEKGAKIITKPEPGEAFENELIAFCYAGFGLNVEIIDTEKRANLIKE